MARNNEGVCVSTRAFSRLPNDLKLDIFDLVRSKIDQGNARLVNRVSGPPSAVSSLLILMVTDRTPRNGIS